MKPSGLWTEMGEQLLQRNPSPDDRFEQVDDCQGALFIAQTFLALRGGFDAACAGCVEWDEGRRLQGDAGGFEALMDEPPRGLVAESFIVRVELPAEDGAGLVAGLDDDLLLRGL